MTANETPAPQTGIAVPEFTVTADWFAAPDYELQRYADYPPAVELFLVLFLPWGSAAGTVCSGAEFFENAHNKARVEAEAHGAEFLRDSEPIIQSMYGDVADAYRQKRKPEDVLRSGFVIDKHIHLKNVTCAQGTYAFNLDYLRVRLNQVTAWTFAQPE